MGKRTPPQEKTPDPWDIPPALDPWTMTPVRFPLADPRTVVHHLRSIRRQRGQPWDQEFPRFIGGGIWIPGKNDPPSRLGTALHSLDKHISELRHWWYPCYCFEGPGLWRYGEDPPFDRGACTCKGYIHAYDRMVRAFKEIVRLAGCEDDIPVPWPLPHVSNVEAVYEALKALAGELTSRDLVAGGNWRKQQRDSAKNLRGHAKKPEDPVTAQKILTLHAQGKSYQQIANALHMRKPDRVKGIVRRWILKADGTFTPRPKKASRPGK